MILFGITILILAMILISVSTLAYNNKQRGLSIFGLTASVIVICISTAIIIYETDKSTTKDVKAEVLQHLNINQSVTLTLRDKIPTYQLNDSTMVDLFNYLTEDDE